MYDYKYPIVFLSILALIGAVGFFFNEKSDSGFDLSNQLDACTQQLESVGGQVSVLSTQNTHLSRRIQQLQQELRQRPTVTIRESVVAPVPTVQPTQSSNSGSTFVETAAGTAVGVVAGEVGFMVLRSMFR